MGMDVIGKSPASKRGEYFRNNVWWWHPLWDYCLEKHNDIAGAVERGHLNDGDGLDGQAARQLGLALLEDLDTGAAAQYAAERNAVLAQLPTSSCEWCGATGIRTDAVGVDLGMPNKELPEAQAIFLGRTHGWCNGCDGSGEMLHPETSYDFNEENVREFAEFCIDSGGFEIW